VYSIDGTAHSGNKLTHFLHFFGGKKMRLLLTGKCKAIWHLWMVIFGVATLSVAILNVSTLSKTIQNDKLTRTTLSITIKESDT
jgi:hypothetical protein